jgi:hypothetical protein
VPQATDAKMIRLKKNLIFCLLAKILYPHLDYGAIGTLGEKLEKNRLAFCLLVGSVIRRINVIDRDVVLERSAAEIFRRV